MNLEPSLLAALPGGGQIEQGRPGTGRPFPAASALLRQTHRDKPIVYRDMLIASNLLQSCSLRTFLRARLRASAAFTRFFSPGFR